MFFFALPTDDTVHYRIGLYLCSPDSVCAAQTLSVQPRLYLYLCQTLSVKTTVVVMGTTGIKASSYNEAINTSINHLNTSQLFSNKRLEHI